VSRDGNADRAVLAFLRLGLRLRDRGDVSLGEPVMAEGGSVEKVKHAPSCLGWICTCGKGKK
jgi:hypothetical protein